MKSRIAEIYLFHILIYTRALFHRQKKSWNMSAALVKTIYSSSKQGTQNIVDVLTTFQFVGFSEESFMPKA